MTTEPGYVVDKGLPKTAINQFSYEEFLAFWPAMEVQLDRIRPLWKHWTKDSILTDVGTGRLVLWGVGSPPLAEFVFFTMVNIYPAMQVLSVPLGFGTLRPEMVPLMDATLENYARMQNCAEIEIHGRRGWGPTFKAVGMRHRSDVWSRSVTNLRLN